MDSDHTFDGELKDEKVESDGQPALDVEALVKKARRSRQIEESDVQAILASADEDQADRLYEQLQRLGIRIVAENGETVEDLGDSSNVLGLDVADDDLKVEEYYTSDSEDDPVHTYLKDIGQVPLLTAEQEIWLATQLAAASVLERLTSELMAEDGEENVHVRTIQANYRDLLASWHRADAASQAINVATRTENRKVTTVPCVVARG